MVLEDVFVWYVSLFHNLPLESKMVFVIVMCHWLHILSTLILTHPEQKSPSLIITNKVLASFTNSLWVMHC